MKITNTGLIIMCCVASLSWDAVSQTRWDVGVNIDNAALEMPWTGGMNAAQFSNIDLNRDGITDMISFDRQGDILRTYIHLPASGRWVLDWEYAKAFPALVDWVLIVDYDKDGVEDIFTSSSPTGVAGISIYKGSYQNEQWSFTKLMDRDKEYLQVTAGGGLTNLYSSWDDIPSINDIDGDGDLDVLAFEPGGSYISYFTNLSVESGWGTDSLRFELEDVCWGKVFENELSEELFLSDTPDACSDGNFQDEDDILIPRHSGSTVMSFDQDQDLDMDALVGDISSRRLVFLRNGLSQEEAWITEQDIHWPSYDTAVYLPYFVAGFHVQLDDDPEREILASINSRSLGEDDKSVWRYDDDVADGPLTFHLNERGFLQNDMIDVGSHARPAVADVNGDGLKDLVVGGYAFDETSITRRPSLWLFLNIGTLAFPHFELISKDYLGMSEFGDDPNFDFAPAYGDIDDNGSIDLVVGDNNGKLFFYRNLAAEGQPMNFATFVYPYMNIAVGVAATPQIADINGDGLGDLIVGERTGNSDNVGRCSNLNYFQNTGSQGNAQFTSDPTLAPNTQCYGRVLFDIPFGLPQYSAPSIAAGKNGLILITGNDPGKLEIYTDLQNGLTGELTLVDEQYGNLDMGNRSAPALADLNEDGKFELIVGNQRGGLELFGTEIEVGTSATQTPADPSGLPYTIFRVNENEWQVMLKEEGFMTGQLFDVQGKWIGGFNEQRQMMQVDLGNVSAGMYLLKILVKNKSFVEKIVH